MEQRISGVFHRPGATSNTTQYVRVVYDNESPDWQYTSRTNPAIPGHVELGQAPAVYRYSQIPEEQPGNWKVDEYSLKFFLYSLNNFNTLGAYDGLGQQRCENYLFESDNALYNKFGFPTRQFLTMSGNKLEVIEWVTENGVRYCKFRTLTPNSNVNEMTFRSHPQFVHLYTIVQLRDGVTITNAKIQGKGYVYFYLVSNNGFAFIPERNVKPL